MQTINNSYKGISVWITGPVLAEEHVQYPYETLQSERVTEKHTAQEHGDWYWSKTFWLSDMHKSSCMALEKSVYKKHNLVLIMANPAFFTWQGGEGVQEEFLWARVEIAACIHCPFAAQCQETQPPRFTGNPPSENLWSRARDGRTRL